MALTFTPGDLNNVQRQIGRGICFYSNPFWSGTGAISLSYLGDTEGRISFPRNPSDSHLRLTEISGEAKRATLHRGEDPDVEFEGIWWAQANLDTLLTQTGLASAGIERARPPRYLTLVVFPELLFYNATNNVYQAITYTSGGTWTQGGSALTATQAALLREARWYWKGYFTKPEDGFEDNDRGGAAPAPVTFVTGWHDDMPANHHQYTKGNPFPFGIDIEAGLAS